jgi:quinol monooxygenase YgiN
VYTSARWTVKEGNEDAFARRWQASADQVALEHPGITFRLLRDTSTPQRFVSVDGPWRGQEQIDAVRELPSFQEAMTEIEGLVDSVEVSTYELVVEIS